MWVCRGGEKERYVYVYMYVTREYDNEDRVPRERRRSRGGWESEGSVVQKKDITRRRCRHMTDCLPACLGRSYPSDTDRYLSQSRSRSRSWT